MIYIANIQLDTFLQKQNWIYYLGFTRFIFKLAIILWSFIANYHELIFICMFKIFVTLPLYVHELM